MKKINTLIISTILLISGYSAYPESFSIGNEDNWKGTALYNLETTAGRGGFQDLIIKTTSCHRIIRQTCCFLLIQMPEKIEPATTGFWKILIIIRNLLRQDPAVQLFSMEKRCFSCPRKALCCQPTQTGRILQLNSGFIRPIPGRGNRSSNGRVWDVLNRIFIPKLFSVTF